MYYMVLFNDVYAYVDNSDVRGIVRTSKVWGVGNILKKECRDTRRGS